MNNENLHKTLIELSEIAEFGGTPHQDKTPHKTFGSGPDAVSFKGTETLNQFDIAVDRFWAFKADIFNTISRESIQKAIIDVLRERNSAGEKPTVDDVDKLLYFFQSLPVYDYEVLRSLYGASFSIEDPLVLGPFIIYKWENHKDAVISKYPWPSDSLKTSELRTSEYMIGMSITAREGIRAIEIADDKFLQFENIIRYMICNEKGAFDVGAFNFGRYMVYEAICLSNKEVRVSASTKGAILPVTIDDQFFATSNGHEWIWKAVGKNNPNDFEKRIISAIEWIGKGIFENDIAKTLVQYTFALESLFTFKKKGVLVNPSVASQLAEFAAFTASDVKNFRLYVEKHIKDVYGNRSAIVHGGQKVVSKSSVSEFLQILRLIITNLITKPEFSSFSSIEQLDRYIKDKKYS